MIASIALWASNINTRLQTKSNLRLFLFFLLIECVYSIVVSFGVNWINPGLSDNNTNDWGMLEKFFLKVVLAPILETLIFQALIIELLLYYQVRALYSIPIAAAIFAAAHYYNPVYAIVTSFAGLLYAYYYYILQKRNKGMAILWVTLLHAAWNFIAFLNNDVLKWF